MGDLDLGPALRRGSTKIHRVQGVENFAGQLAKIATTHEPLEPE